jgi:RHS repeat-associated protein
MAQYAFHVMLVSLNIVDTPVGYIPPRGPAVTFKVTYNQREANQPDTFTYSNLGNKWTFDWLAYITDNPTNTSADAEYFLRGGGTDSYTGYSAGRYDYQQESRSELDRTSSTRYELKESDGSKFVFDLPDGSTSYPRKVFLTQEIDPAGNTLTFTYDSTFRLIAATDAINQVTTVSYGSSDTNSSLYYKITKVTDPFGRFATFQYNASGQLTNITDVIGINSSFTYGTGDFINSLTTPYGTTIFSSSTGGGTTRVLEATDPLGQTEHLEYHDQAPKITPSETLKVVGMDVDNLHCDWRNSFYWDKKAWHDAPGDFTKAHNYHFLHHDATTTSGILESDKPALESRIWLNYQGQVGPNRGPNAEGTNGQPTMIGRVLDDGSTQLYQYSYNYLGHTTQSVDPIGRTILLTYATNGIDLTQVWVVNGANNDLIASFTYNSQHLPLSATDAAGQVTHFAYNAYGQITGVTNALGQSTTLYYNAKGLVTNLIAAVSGATNGFTYDATNRVRTVTDSDGYSVTYDYDVLDRVTRITFPDNTFQQIIYDKLDPVLIKDRRGHWSRKTYDALRRLTAVEDTLGRITQYSWCNCGSLGSITDPLGRTTTLLRDIEGRVTDRILPDGSQSTFAYGVTSSRLLSSTDAKKQTALFDYYADDTIKQVAYSNAVVPTSTITYTYDTNYPRLVSVADSTGTTAYTYNLVNVSPTLGAGKLASMDGPLSNDTITYYYDELGRVTNRAINGVAETVAFDALGRLTVLTNALGRFTNVYEGVSARISTNYYPNGQKTDFIYFDNAGNKRLQTLWHKNASGITISRFDYTYDAEDIIKTWTQQLDSQNPTVWSAEYDSADQLTGVTIRTNSPAGAVLKQFVYSYDKAANRFNEEIDLGASGANYAGFDQLVGTTLTGLIRLKGHLSETGTVRVANSPALITGSTNFSGFASLTSGTDVVQVAATDLSNNTATNKYQLIVTNAGVPRTLTYDPNGNLVSDATAFSTNSYEWDAGDKLTTMTRAITNAPAATTEFTYDAWGRRVRITEKTNGVIQCDRRFVWAAAELGEERDATGATVTKRFFASGEQISGTNYYYTKDHLGSVREMLDTGGNLKARYDYDPYGRRTRTSGTLDSDFGFAGRYYHAPSGLHLTFFRVYDSTVGRWLSRDPIGQPSDLNLYCYADNNPLNFIDPFGLAPCDWANWIDNKIDAAFQKITTTSTLWNYNVFSMTFALKFFPDILRFGSGIGDAIYNPCTKPFWKGVEIVQDILRGFVLYSFLDMALKSVLGKALEAAEAAAEELVARIAGPKCFAAGTLVATPKGEQSIEDLRAGDYVLSLDENTGRITTNTVVDVFWRTTDETVDLKIGQEEIITTREHPFWMEKVGWVPAGLIRTGDILRTRSGSVEVTSVTQRPAHRSIVYNFEVAGAHNYFVSKSDLLVHNPMCFNDLIKDFKANPQNWERIESQISQTTRLGQQGGVNVESVWQNRITGDRIATHEAFGPAGKSIHPENVSPNLPGGGSIRPTSKIE